MQRDQAHALRIAAGRGPRTFDQDWSPTNTRMGYGIRRPLSQRGCLAASKRRLIRRRAGFADVVVVVKQQGAILRLQHPRVSGRGRADMLCHSWRLIEDCRGHYHCALRAARCRGGFSKAALLPCLSATDRSNSLSTLLCVASLLDSPRRGGEDVNGTGSSTSASW